MGWKATTYRLPCGHETLEYGSKMGKEKWRISVFVGAR